METVDWDRVTAEFRIRTTKSLRTLLVDDDEQALATVDMLDDCFKDLPDQTVVAARLVDTFSSSRRRADGPLIAACYIHARCLEAWEGTTGWSVIGQVLHAVAALPIDEVTLGVDLEQRELIEIVLQHAQCLIDCMAVEAGLNCSCPTAVRQRAERVVIAAHQTLERLDTARTIFAGAVTYLATIARTELAYFSMIREIATAIANWVDAAPDAQRRLEGVVHDLAQVEREIDLSGDVYESELRSYRWTLEELGRRCSDPLLQVEQGSAVYVYPFSFIRPVSRQGVMWLAAHKSEVLRWQLSSVGPLDVQALDVNQGLTDMWTSSDLQGRAYRGVRVLLPPLRIQTTDGYTLNGSAEVRLSELGNNYLRVQVEIAGGHPHYVNQALRRGSEHMGDECVQSASAASWARLSEYAQDIVNGFANELVPRLAVARPTLTDRPTVVHGPHHVVLSIRRMAKVSNGVREAASGTDLLRDDILGTSLFWQPIATAAATLEEWVRYAPPSSQNILEHRGFRDDLVLQTSNTTIIAMPGKPSFLITNFEEGAEFIATLRAMLENWRRRVLASVSKASAALEAIDEEIYYSQRPSAGHLRDIRSALEAEQGDLRKTKSDASAVLALLKSPTLVDTTLQREYLDRLWHTAGLDKEEADLAASIQQAQDSYAHSVAVAAGLEARSEDRRLHRLNFIASIVGLTGIADFFSLMNGIFEGDSKSFLEGEVSFILLLLLATSIVYFRRRLEGVTEDAKSFRRKRDTRNG